MFSETKYRFAALYVAHQQTAGNLGHYQPPASLSFSHQCLHFLWLIYKSLHISQDEKKGEKASLP